MSKEHEIAYIRNLAEIQNISRTVVEDFHLRKPFSDARCGYYLMDIGQLMILLPPAPARILDLGVGSGWTSKMLAQNGYTVLGLDIALDMIAMARQHATSNLDLHFEVHDYEESIDFGLFDAVVIYDALHHAIDEARVIANVFHCLKPNGVFITMEPGVGHSTTPESLDAIKKFGTTEKDMEYSHQAKLMRQAGFGSIRQYLRLNQLLLEDVATTAGIAKQSQHFNGLTSATANGLTSVVVAVKDAEDSGNSSEAIAQLPEESAQQSQLQPEEASSTQLQEDLVEAQIQLQQTQLELQRSLGLIEAMKTSKFWKLRTQWFKLKKLMGLKTDD